SISEVQLLIDVFRVGEGVIRTGTSQLLRKCYSSATANLSFLKKTSHYGHLTQTNTPGPSYFSPTLDHPLATMIPTSGTLPGSNSLTIVDPASRPITAGDRYQDPSKRTKINLAVFLESISSWKLNIHPNLKSFAASKRFSSRIAHNLAPPISPSTLTSFPRTRHLPLIRDRVAGAAGSAETSICPSPQTPPPAPPGGPKELPGQPRDIVPPVCPGPSPGPPPGGTCLEHLPRKASRRHPV
ncbi:hypothetical protein AMECASPLE_016109, partial [Ameca splendens]